MSRLRFEWDRAKDDASRAKHEVSFSDALGKVNEGVMTVRFTYRAGVIRIFGAGYWRKGKTIYEQQNQVHE